jgi:serine protease Do
MATAVNPAGRESISVGGELARVAEQVQRLTVQVQCEHGGGSGVIWQPDGVIVTNAHVASAREHMVVLGDGRRFEAQVIARDRSHDVVSMKITATELPSARVRDSSSLRTGEVVIAVGNPLGAAGALATGIVHAPAAGRPWVQADIRLAPGNSGGPLCDVEGRVIGVNSMIANGLALAVPSSTVQQFLAGEGRPRIGVTVRPVLVRAAGQATLGLMVVGLEPNSAAHLAGVMVGDVVVSARGTRVQQINDLPRAIAAASESGTLVLELIRAGELKSCHVKLDRNCVRVA